MNFARKICGIFILALLSAVIIYPILHETGHCITAIITGSEITEIGVFPLPYVMCEMACDDYISCAITGLGGLTFPLFVSMMLKPRKFWLWYIVLAVKATSIYTLAYSMFSAFLFSKGIFLPNDDIVALLTMFPDKNLYLFTVLFVMFVIGVTTFLKEKPLSKCAKFFEISSNKTGACA